MSCFHQPSVFRYKNDEYEYIGDWCSEQYVVEHEFRIISHRDVKPGLCDYDYVEDKELIKELQRVWKSLGTPTTTKVKVTKVPIG